MSYSRHNTCTGNAVLVRGDNYVLAGGAVLISIALCYGLMWIGVIREYKKFEDVINEKIRYYESVINAPLSAQLSRDWYRFLYSHGSWSSKVRSL